MHGPTKISAGPLLLRIALVLLCMVAFSTSMLAGLYARYSTKADGEDSARVARFDVKAEGLSDDVTVNASQADAAGTYQFTVKNDSEVAITYDLVITFEGGIPSYAQVSLDGKSGTSNGNSITFSDVASLAPAAPSKNHTLTFTVNMSKLDALTYSADGEAYSQKVAFTATVRCTQID